MTKNPPETLAYLDKFTSRKVKETLEWEISRIPDSLLAWITRYLHVAVVGLIHTLTLLPNSGEKLTSCRIFL